MLLLLCSLITRLHLEDSQLHPLSSHIFQHLSKSWLGTEFLAGRCYCTLRPLLNALAAVILGFFELLPSVDSI